MLSDSKSVLAKLLATENIRIEHRKVKTAFFNLKDRVLVCPIWGDMSPELYDLLMGHEVGHAKFTPETGWHDAVVDNTKSGYKTYLNVIEDARIERMIKSEYPGLKASFSKAYNELTRNEFFGSKDIVESDYLPLIDRINLHFKIGAFANVKFDATEKHYIQMVEECETWEDVVRVADALYENGKQEQEGLRDLLEELMKDFDYEMSDDQDDLGDDGQPFEMDSNGDQKGDNIEGTEDSDIEQLQEILDMMSRGGGGDEGEEPRSITDDVFRSKENEFLDAKSRPYVYADLPEVRLENIIIPHQFVAEKIKEFRLQPWSYDAASKNDTNQARAIFGEMMEKTYIDFMTNNKKYVSYLVKEFEMRRNAKQYARAQTAKTGEIDVKKAFSYKFSEDIFKRVTTIPGGKNHGMVMVMDCSGSMYGNLKGTIQQTILLAMFCRKVNIPFRVFGFSNSFDSKIYQEYFKLPEDMIRSYWNEKNTQFSLKDGQLYFGEQFYLKEYLSNEMSSKQFNEMTKHWLMVGELAGESEGSKWTHFQVNENDTWRVSYPLSEELGGTPLNEAILAATEYVKNFKRDYKLDVVNAIFLTDGEGHHTAEVVNGIPEIKSRDFYTKMGAVEKYEFLSVPRRSLWQDGDMTRDNFVVIDRKTGVRGTSPAGASETVAFLDYMRNITGANIVGFHLMYKTTPNRINDFAKLHGVWLSENDLSIHSRSMKQNKFAAIPVRGMKQFFLMPGGKDLDIEDDTLENVSSDVKDIRKAFMKMQKNKLVNRVFLNRFIEQVA